MELAECDGCGRPLRVGEKVRYRRAVDTSPATLTTHGVAVRTEEPICEDCWRDEMEVELRE
jgi:hypothetical protein